LKPGESNPLAPLVPQDAGPAPSWVKRAMLFSFDRRNTARLKFAFAIDGGQWNYLIKHYGAGDSADVPYSFDFDWKHRILRSRFYGRITDEELTAYYRTLYQKYFRLQPIAGLLLLSETTVLETSAKVVREWADSAPAMHDPNGQLVIIAPSPELYQRAQKFRLLARGTRPNIQVVRTEQEAWAILAVKNPQFEPLETESRRF